MRGATISDLTLLKEGANVNLLNNDKNSPLGCALVAGHNNLGIFLIQNDADIYSPIYSPAKSESSKVKVDVILQF